MSAGGRLEGRLQGRRILITGGTRGLGRALAEVCVAEGARVAITWSRSEQDAAETLAVLGPDARAFRGSVADPAHSAAVIRALVNQVLPVALIEDTDWDAVMDVNAKGAFLFSRAALRPMIRAKSGHILSVGSFSEGRVMEAPVHYAASKGALRGMTEALAREVGRYGIQVNLLAPAFTALVFVHLGLAALRRLRQEEGIEL